MPRTKRSFQGRHSRSARALPSGPVGWEDVEEWERAADGAAANANPANRPAANAIPNATANDDDLRCTPWRRREELLAVRDLLYSPEEEGEEGAMRAVKKRRLGVSTV